MAAATIVLGNAPNPLSTEGDPQYTNLGTIIARNI